MSSSELLKQHSSFLVIFEVRVQHFSFFSEVRSMTLVKLHAAALVKISLLGWLGGARGALAAPVARGLASFARGG